MNVRRFVLAVAAWACAATYRHVWPDSGSFLDWRAWAAAVVMFVGFKLFAASERSR